MDQHTLTLPDDLPPGIYRLEIGLYDASLPDLRRPGDSVLIDGFVVGE